MSNTNTVRGISRIAVLSMLAAAGVATAPAHATNSIVVKAGADAQATYIRLQRAARELCSPYERHQIPVPAAYRLCYERTLDDAVASMNQPALLALHRQRQAGAGAG